jgi:UDP-N-acetyl-2-amino-2-deoxyglucuronate dehydrogenase
VNFLAALAGREALRVDLETNRQSIAIITGVRSHRRTGELVTTSSGCGEPGAFPPERTAVAG